VAKVNVYIDGFNLYYGVRSRGRAFKWLDLAKLCHALLPADTRACLTIGPRGGTPQRVY
jgi:hypothetical protein